MLLSFLSTLNIFSCAMIFIIIINTSTSNFIKLGHCVLSETKLDNYLFLTNNYSIIIMALVIIQLFCKKYFYLVLYYGFWFIIIFIFTNFHSIVIIIYTRLFLSYECGEKVYAGTLEQSYYLLDKLVILRIFC